MTRFERDYLPKLINQHVPFMTYSADVGNSGDYLAHLGTPIAADGDFLVTAGSTLSGIATGLTFLASQLANSLISDSSHPYGVNVKFLITGAITQANSRSLTVVGRDYLGQPMSEIIAAGATEDNVTLVGIKAFKFFDSITLSSGYSATLGQGLTVGIGAVLGLPYKAIGMGIEVKNKSTVGTGGTFVAGLATSVTPTATTADSRGTYAPGDVPDAATIYQIELFVDRTNMHGVSQFG